jgi:hypothetical protein
MTTDTVKIEKFHQDRLWVIQAFSIERPSVDGWEAAVREYIQHVNAPERYLVYDLTPIASLGFTMYMRQRTTALAKDNREATGRVAIAMSLSPIYRHVFEPFIRFTGRQLQPRLTVKLFGSRTEAIDWVASSLPAEAKMGE